MKEVLVVGAGRVGRTIAHMLAAEEGYDVLLCDARPEAAAQVAAEVEGIHAHPDSVRGKEGVRKALHSRAAVVSAAPFVANPLIAETAAEAGVHYLDLTEDVQVTRFVKGLAEEATTALIPQCGVAPGFISIAGVHLVGQLEDVDTLTLRVGALPRQPNERLVFACQNQGR